MHLLGNYKTFHRYRFGNFLLKNEQNRGLPFFKYGTQQLDIRTFSRLLFNGKKMFSQQFSCEKPTNSKNIDDIV